MASYDETADELYALRPANFTAARDDAVKAAKAQGDKDLAKQLSELRKPTVTAWLVNLLARDQSELVDGLVELGAQLREAQNDLQAAELRELNRQRQQMVAAVAQQAKQLGADAGARVTEATLREVEATLGAALADPDSAAAVQGGRLTGALSYSGLGGPTTTPAPGPAKAKKTPLEVVREDRAAKADAAKRAAERRAALESAVDSARKALDAADLGHAQAERAAEDAAAAHAAAGETVERVQSQLAAAQDGLRAASRALTSRGRELTAATAHAESAATELDRAEGALAED